MPNNDDFLRRYERMDPGFEKDSKVTCIRKSWSLLNSTKMNHRCCWPFFYEGNEQYCTSGFQRPFLLEDTQWKLSCWNFNDMFIMISLLIYVFIALEKYTIFIYTIHIHISSRPSKTTVFSPQAQEDSKKPTFAYLFFLIQKKWEKSPLKIPNLLI